MTGRGGEGKQQGGQGWVCGLIAHSLLHGGHLRDSSKHTGSWEDATCKTITNFATQTGSEGQGTVKRVGGDTWGGVLSGALQQTRGAVTSARHQGALGGLGAVGGQQYFPLLAGRTQAVHWEMFKLWKIAQEGRALKTGRPASSQRHRMYRSHTEAEGTGKGQNHGQRLTGWEGPSQGIHGGC